MSHDTYELLRMGHVTYESVMSRMNKSCDILMGREVRGYHSDSDDAHYGVGCRVSGCG